MPDRPKLELKDFNNAAAKLSQGDVSGAATLLLGLLARAAIGNPVLEGLTIGAAQRLAVGLTTMAASQAHTVPEHLDQERELLLQLASGVLALRRTELLPQLLAASEQPSELDAEDRSRALDELFGSEPLLACIRVVVTQLRSGRTSDARQLAPDRIALSDARQFVARRRVRSEAEQLAADRRALAEARTLTAYRRALVEAHSDLPGLFHCDHEQLDSAKLRPVGFAAPVGGQREGDRILSLEDLLRNDAGNRRWLVVGRAGSGKTTMARHVVWKLAPSLNGPLPVLVPLRELAREPELHPFAWAARELGEPEAEDGPALERLLHERAAQPDGVWLLLDGLNEVESQYLEGIKRRMRMWALSEALRKVPIAIFARAAALRPGEYSYAQRAELLPLADEQRARLFRRWIPEVGLAQQTVEQVRNVVGLDDLCSTPLMVAIIARLAPQVRAQTRSSAALPLPRSRGKLLRLTVKTLLERGHSWESIDGACDPDGARHTLRGLALVLQHSRETCWSFPRLVHLIHGLPDAQLDAWNGDPAAFLEELRARTRVLHPAADYSDPDTAGRSLCDWQFLHPQLRQLLAAEALLQQGPGALAARVREIGKNAESASGWTEVLGFACELAMDPLGQLVELAAVNTDVALRVLARADGLDSLEALAALAPQGVWDGDWLVALIERWRLMERDAFDAGQVSRWLWGLVTPAVPVERLAHLHYALEHLLRIGDPDAVVDREAFFVRCGRWPAAAADPGSMVRLPAGSFLMGSLQSEKGRSATELRHPVSISTFELCRYAVTNAQYEQFDPQHERGLFAGKLSYQEAATHPVVRVSWWEAYLYCRWQGGRLPTEAEWEYACRAGSEAAFAFGVDVSTKQVNCGGAAQTVAVGQLPPNARGLHEMHGNVDEWCADWYGDYSPETQHDPLGPARGTERVVRGGSAGFQTQYCRSASRDYWAPADRREFVGFRMARDCWGG